MSSTVSLEQIHKNLPEELHPYFVKEGQVVQVQDRGLHEVELEQVDQTTFVVFRWDKQDHDQFLAFEFEEKRIQTVWLSAWKKKEIHTLEDIPKKNPGNTIGLIKELLDGTPIDFGIL